ncbi:MAG: helix-turn-helix domain-containing protein [Clostridia bacterium]|nr:helix-turn-helix domain-containing protein [Clostridia bacterium]
MSYTKFAEFLRILRIKNHETMGDTAKLLGVNVAFVSAVENGKKNVPEDWVDKLAKHYNLNEQEKQELLGAIEDSKTTSKISLVAVPHFKRQVALQFQRSFDNIDEETARKILDLLGEN